MQNFNSLMAIVVGLKSAPIYRLKKTWNVSISNFTHTYKTRILFNFLYYKAYFET